MAAIQVDSTIDQLASQVASSTGLQKDVILAHWMSEEPINNINSWPSNNGAGIRPGNSQVDAIAAGVNNSGFDIFQTPQAFAQAYADLMNNDPNYAQVRQVIKQYPNNPRLSGQLEIQAIANSGWDANHYAGNTGKKGYNLYQNYATVTGSQINNIYNNPAKAVIQDTTNGIQTNLAKFLGVQSINWWEILIVVVGVVLVAVLLYRVVTK